MLSIKDLVVDIQGSRILRERIRGHKKRQRRAQRESCLEKSHRPASFISHMFVRFHLGLTNG